MCFFLRRPQPRVLQGRQEAVFLCAADIQMSSGAKERTDGLEVVPSTARSS